MWLWCVCAIVFYLLSELAVEPYGFKTPPVLKVCYLHL